MRSKKTKDGYILVFDNAGEATLVKEFIARGIYAKEHKGENAYGESKNPYDLNNVPGFRHH